MTPLQQAQAAGLKNMAQVIELTGQSAQTLNNWHKNKPQLFAVVLRGCADCQRCKHLEMINQATR